MFNPVMAMTTGFEAHRINRTIHFRLAQQLGNLFMQGSVFRQISNFKPLRLGVSQTDRVHIADNHYRRAEQTR